MWPSIRQKSPALRRLALGHWLRRWWPASQRDGIAGLDRALLDVEVALLTADAQGFFTDDTLDSDVAELLAPHAPALNMHVRDDDPRIRDLVRAGAGLADDIGVDGVGWSELFAALHDSSAILEMPTGCRDDHALAAGSDAGPRGAAPIARGVASINIIGPDPATGVTVLVRSGEVGGSGALDADGHARLPLLDAQQRPLTESVAWDHDWTNTSVVVGADRSELRETRERVRGWARARLDPPAADAFLAEILAGESSY
ncbi:MAG: hypothetical protein WBR28_01580 [Mycobacterium sp.]